MELFVANVAALAVALIYYTWRAYCRLPRRRTDRLRERVTYMLWVMAQRVDAPKEAVAD